MSDLLFLAQRLPYPPAKGEKIRAYHALRYLAQRYNVYLGCLMDDPSDMAHVPTLRAHCRDLYAATIDRRVARIACLRGILTGEGLSVSYFHSMGLAHWVRDVMTRVRPARIFVYSSNMAPYILDFPCNERRIADIVDVDSEKWRALADATRGPMRLVYRREAHKISALESRVVAESNAAVLVSDAEASLLARQVPEHARRIFAIGNGVNTQYFDPHETYPAVYEPGPPTFVFTGTMNYRPNQDAVTWFATDILPIVRQTVSDARFVIVGSNPTSSVLSLAQRGGVIVTGAVPDIRPYLARATAAVAPLRIARGVQNKVLEAMAMACPVVLTSAALEGIKATPEQELLVADTPKAFAAACCRTLDHALALSLGTAARARMLRDYTWAEALSRLGHVVAGE